MSRTLGGPPRTHEGPEDTQGKIIGIFKHCITKPSGNHQNVKRKWFEVGLWYVPKPPYKDDEIGGIKKKHVCKLLDGHLVVGHGKQPPPAPFLVDKHQAAISANSPRARWEEVMLLSTGSCGKAGYMPCSSIMVACRPRAARRGPVMTVTPTLKQKHCFSLTLLTFPSSSCH